MIKSNKKGFTLIELLIVIAIIGILASVVLVGLGPIQKRGRDARRIADMKQIQTGLELWYGANGAYPTGAMTWAQFQALAGWAAVGVTKLPSDPLPARSYGYCATASQYVLGATLDDTTNPVLANDIDAAANTWVSVLAGCTGVTAAPAPVGCGITGGADATYCVQL